MGTSPSHDRDFGSDNESGGEYVVRRNGVNSNRGENIKSGGCEMRLRAITGA
ncbi:fructose-bisphosphate aldolase [Blastopirellula marina DSM 3645]|uniref:Fructose-bisphosphate aldolase n=1 Tax=Blastopirellula marina DSM 3645 TaxID=314230 RepID=A3ZMQ0_9BACT|nr:fructose-bisphosphate aldolase [Blastopirellula marina DSM 3645]